MPFPRNPTGPAANLQPNEAGTYAPISPRSSDGLLVVAIGASAGGLDAFRALIPTLPVTDQMVFVLVQHLDPTHESLLVDLLSGSTAMPVSEARQGMRIAGGNIYVISPGSYLALKAGEFQTSEPVASQNVRLPFDFLLGSIASACGRRGACVVLSGTGTDGTAGLQAVKQAGGYAIVQDPMEAAYKGMPQSAVSTGEADLVLPLAKMAEALVKRVADVRKASSAKPPIDDPEKPFEAILELLRVMTKHDFRLYKPGTLNRRIERRMVIAGLKITELDRYLQVLTQSPKELEDIARDLMINVTGFFRDPKVFDYLAATTIPGLVAAHTSDDPLRVWIAGCSTGEEAYSVAILFLEAIASAKRAVRLQIFASDIDAEAVAVAREGIYPASALSGVTKARAASFFLKEETGFRVNTALRSCLVFTVHDLLADPPFSRLDMVSCRNLLIYLNPEAEAKAISLFHFALRPGGILLLGNAESTGRAKDQFEPIGRAERVYRQVGRGRPGDSGMMLSRHDRALDGVVDPGPAAPLRQSAMAELCRQQILANFSPAAALVTAKHEVVYLSGPAERYLRVPPGHPTHDLLAMAPAGARAKLRAAIRQAVETGDRISVEGGRTEREGQSVRFKIVVQPVKSAGETLCLVCFVEHVGGGSIEGSGGAGDGVQILELKRELEATKTELRGAILDLELSSEEQKAINEDALSVNEEFQSTNEELLTSKEELQSLNEELTALNGQLQETLERQRTTAEDLENVLYSTDLATLFLDRDLKIRFFTPATKLLFNILPTDIGRPLSDFNPLGSDQTLTFDAATVLKTLVPLEKEIETASSAWYARRILPYRAHDGSVEGVVITFSDVTERKHDATALDEARKVADRANLAKSRFLAVASHDLRQPLQALSLLQGLLAKVVDGDRAKTLVLRFGETLGALSGMLNSLLDINQIESGALQVSRLTFPINDILERLTAEFSHQAQAAGLTLRKIRTSLWTDSDPRLLEQMIRNLLANALKYTKHGRVIMGCRRRGGSVLIEIWDSGVGIPESQLKAIFEEYHQVNNPGRDRSLGLGLGLSIVQRLGNLLQHPVNVQSRPGKGSVFSIEVTRRDSPPALLAEGAVNALQPVTPTQKTGAILLVEDDPDLRELLMQALVAEGHTVVAAVDGPQALERVAAGSIRPDLILTDFNLPGGMNGLELAAKVRHALNASVAAAILTGDISSATLRNIAHDNCVHLSKPVKLTELNTLIQVFLSQPVAAPRAESADTGARLVYVVDDDRGVREAICSVLEDAGLAVEAFGTAEAFLEAYHQGQEACLLVDAYLPGMNGLDLMQQLVARGHRLPTTMITGHGDIAIAVEAMKAGAIEFIEKPIAGPELLTAVTRALDLARDATSSIAWHADARAQITTLTNRQREIMDLILAGHPNKNIAADLGISQRTVENHRASIMKKTGAKSLPALARLAVAAA